MGNKPVISKQQILDTAFAIASESGLSGLSIREVARACNVACLLYTSDAADEL